MLVILRHVQELQLVNKKQLALPEVLNWNSIVSPSIFGGISDKVMCIPYDDSETEKSQFY